MLQHKQLIMDSGRFGVALFTLALTFHYRKVIVSFFSFLFFFLSIATFDIYKMLNNFYYKILTFLPTLNKICENKKIPVLILTLLLKQLKI